MSTQPLPMPAPEGVKNFINLKKEYGLYSPDELAALAETVPSASTRNLVEALIPVGSVNIMVGDSGIGKSPLAYQLALSIASGTPFLGMATRKGKVLLVDYENSVADANRILKSQREHLALSGSSETLLLWPMQLDPMQADVEEVISIFAPDFVIIDSLRSFSPTMESDSSAAVEQIKRLRFIAAERGTAFLLIHHVRKNQSHQSALDSTDVMDWLVRSAGVRALINQTDLRLAVAKDADGLLLRGHYRTRGEVGPFLLRRKHSAEDGEPLGYVRASLDPRILHNPDQEASFEKLPETFSFKDACGVLDKSRTRTRVFLQKMIRLGLVRQTGRGSFCKGAIEVEQEHLS